MVKRPLTLLSLVSDLLQVGGFLGLTPAILLTAITAVVGWVSNVPAFYLVVGSLLAFSIAVFISRSFMIRVGTVPLASAAQQAYEQLRGTLWGAAAERMRVDATPEGILDYLATGLSLHTPIYGRYLPSQILEKIPNTDLRSGRLEQGATVLRLDDGRQLRVEGLVVRKRDLRAAIQHMRASTAEFS
jgi:hypothetical protein